MLSHTRLPAALLLLLFACTTSYWVDRVAVYLKGRPQCMSCTLATSTWPTWIRVARGMCGWLRVCVKWCVCVVSQITCFIRVVVGCGINVKLVLISLTLPLMMCACVHVCVVII